ncbi:pyridine nucleotide-disulphide oxidoreductase dimerization region [Acidimicrobium ferrooxidans DSM 10331]|uniref:Pyridine nucleotide-disulphide oxidoreductase dimerization region n=1 Tax=Acidimicrobium ferrooxidans (strain DSM 10331 / JCM 15462 / NBRC 103882 / ICP) TaxID=525909 RepID=C7M1C4_ACIFD|nr:FAD-dependent oxidoreductase [Acidimicrobium ferrooxidans]ACU54772.1 pyridine nucleotide-disulphide oxidoreductase dimerization region [Acidimicrobium ferrooxidans DSM 10331]
MMRLLCIGGSDGGISAALRARELDASAEITVVLADDYPNFSICGIPYHVSGDVADWHDLAHRTRSDLEALGITLLTGHTARRIDVAGHTVVATDADGREISLGYDRLVLATGATPLRPPIGGLDQLGHGDGVHAVHAMEDLHAVMASLATRAPSRAVIVGAGYIGLEMAEALTTRGIAVSVLEALPHVLPTLDGPLGDVVAEELATHGVAVYTSTTAKAITTEGRRLRVHATWAPEAEPRALELDAELVLVVTGVAPDTALARAAGLELTPRGAIRVDRTMRTNAPDVLAAGDCVVTYHALLGETYLPLGTTAHKQGRIAGENALGGDRHFAGSLGTQVVKVFDLVAARTGIRDGEAERAGFRPRTVASSADDHKAYYPGATSVRVRMTGDLLSGRLLGVQMVGALTSAVHKRIDTAAAALFAGLSVDELGDLDLSYTPPLGSPWDVLQVASQRWISEARPVDDAH